MQTYNSVVVYKKGHSMKATIVHAIFFVILCALIGCNDQGEIPEYVEILSLRPGPNETNVDKGRFVQIELSRPVPVSQAAKIRFRYIGDTSTIVNNTYCGLTPPEVRHLCAGPFIWKPGRTVEVTLPKTITDIEGRTPERDFVYRFTIAQDTAPFRLVSSVPANGDTITLPATPYTSGKLTFNDYVHVPNGVLTITPPARIHPGVLITVDGRETPQRDVHFALQDLSPASTYEIIVPAQIVDYEGDFLSHEYRIVFYTR